VKLSAFSSRPRTCSQGELGMAMASGERKNGFAVSSYFYQAMESRPRV
jgi:hypothetical protein